MNILVIGNGFDVAHGLPTKYQDFLEFVDYFERNFIYEKDITNYSVFNLEKSASKYKDYFDQLEEKTAEEYISLIKDNPWFFHFKEMYYEKLANKQNWIDFEAEISNVIQELDRIRKKLLKDNPTKNENAHEQIETEVIIIKRVKYEKRYIHDTDFSLKRLNGIKLMFINNLSRLTRCLELYLTDYLDYYIRYDECEKKEPFKSTKYDHVLNFNYTNTYRKIYRPDITNTIEKHFCNYIHGKAKKENTIENCDLVLGIEEYLKGDDRNKDNEYIEFKKFYQRIFKGTGSLYTRWLNKAYIPDDKNDPEKRIYTSIYGHSIATTDGDIIKNLIEASYKTTIYYHSKDALHDIILNLVQIIGEEELITRTSDDSRSIIFKPTP